MNLRDTIIPKSDQLNADDLIGISKTIVVTGVARGNAEQPVIINYEGDDGRPYKPCKSMRRLLIAAWGEDGREWKGRAMTLFTDPDVKFGGVKLGGIRISHVSHIKNSWLSMMLTTTRSKRSEYKVDRLNMTGLPPVLDAIAGATDTDGLKAAAGAASGLVGDEDKMKAREAYKARAAAINMTESIIAAAAKANSDEEYGEILDLARSLPEADAARVKAALDARSEAAK